MSSVQHLLITGANGYVGQHVVGLARELGIPMTVLGRRAPAGAAIRLVSWNLGDIVPASAFQPDSRFGPVTCAVHLAHDWKADERHAGDAVNVDGAQRLLAAARAAQVPRVLVASSQSAVPQAKNSYGRAKYRIETLLQPPREIAVRMGLVYGGRWGGPAGTLLGFTTRLPVIPLIAPAAPLAPIHVEDVARGLLALATAARPLPGRVVLAGSATTFREFVQTLSQAAGGGRPIPWPVPAQAIEALGNLKLIPSRYLERLLGLVALLPFAEGWDAELLGFMPRALADGLEPLRRRTERRQLLSEANVLLRYVLGEAPSPLVVRRYATAAARWDGNKPIQVPRLARLAPLTLRMFDPVQRGRPLRRRLDIAMAVADASPQGYRRFYADGTGYWPIVRLVVTILVEIALLPLRLWCERR